MGKVGEKVVYEVREKVDEGVANMWLECSQPHFFWSLLTTILYIFYNYEKMSEVEGWDAGEKVNYEVSYEVNEKVDEWVMDMWL